MRRGLTIGAVLVTLGLMLAACGVKGSLEAPAADQAARESSATADSGQGKPEGAAPKPHKGFILDGLLR